MWLLGLIIPYSLFLWWKKEPNWMIAALVIISFSTYFYTSQTLHHREHPIPKETTLIWTDTYTINGSKLRGFAKLETGEKVYAVQTFRSQHEKEKYEQSSLSGIKFQVKGKLVQPTLPAHQYAFSMENYIKSHAAQGIYEIEQATYIKREKTLSASLAEQRFRIKKHIEKTFPESLVAEAQSLIIGEQENVDQDLNRAYQKLGITHLFAISGLHVALVSVLIYELLLRLHIRREHATFVIMITLPIYACIAGGAPSVWRSVIVVEMVMFCKVFLSNLSIDDALALSFIVFVLYQPSIIFQIGFQLSYLATVALVFSNAILQSTQNSILKSLYITTVCQLLVYPLLIYHFFELSLSSFLANIIFVPLFSLIILPINIVLFVLTTVCLPLAQLLFFIYEPLRMLVTKSIMWLQAIPYQMWVTGRPSVIICCLAFIGVLVAFVCIEKRHYIMATFCILIPAIVIHIAPSLHKDVRITFLNVGQGDCVVIELPYRKKVYVVDTGGLLRFNQEQWKQSKTEYEVGRRIVVPYLKGRGIREVDTLLMTHADADHVEGAEEVMEEIRVNEIHISPSSWEKSVMLDVIDLVKKERIPVKEKMANEKWREGDVYFEYLSPTDTHYEGNNDSLVLLLRYGAFKLLLTGDLEEEGELQLVKNNTQSIENLTILKAGHHGSKTSSAVPFLETTNPKLTIFSTGLNNRYGHPNKEVVERYNSLKLPTLNTAEVGSIEVNVTKERWQIMTTYQLIEMKKALSK
ncbi:DNA internalization-related competence protein ComEC/Rec2 [Rummeliibacillus pycnus]|uniref:DNA internalization-related competence protein ComEC/Rec2 n=1 Tax=Rummeliibacillus pycnus TaxID=101070 RepID=UPI003D2C5366